MLRHLIAAVVPLGAAFLGGCGTMGGTNPFVLDLDPALRSQGGASIRVASAAMEDSETAHLVAVNVYPWGTFGVDDLRNIERSLRETISANATAQARDAGAELDVHLVIRRYVVSASNTAGAVFASVTWAATAADGRLLYQEQFYAADSVMVIGTVGLLKDSIHRSIVRRIASGSLALASQRPRAPSFEKTYTSAEEAAATLPAHMVSLGHPLSAAAGAVVGLLIPNGIQKVEWQLADRSGGFDWAGYLGRLRAIR